MSGRVQIAVCRLQVAGAAVEKIPPRDLTLLRSLVAITSLLLAIQCAPETDVADPAFADPPPSENVAGPPKAQSPTPKAQPYTNRLIHEKSPYLLQHAHNPVDWYPWGEEAFAKARDDNKPIFLSIGYSTCHWCHVMEEESFSDPVVAEAMNTTFVCIKVDREERPDIDSVYMTVSQMLTGRGGWPLTILMTPDRKPFFAATYIPKGDRLGAPGLMSLIPQVSRAWSDKGAEITAQADRIASALQKAVGGDSGDALPPSILADAYRSMNARFDERNGGFLPAPKFPSPHQLLFFLRYWKRSGDARALEIVETTLHAMRNGGIWDHVGFGFHRYSTDPVWLVPHFEKMLYDQAMLAMAYTEAYQATGKREYRESAEKIFEYVLRDMRDPKGGFHSAEDADSEGKEGKFYLWTDAEIRRILGPDAQLFIEAYGVGKDGNIKDPVGEDSGAANILHVVKSAADLAASRKMTAEQVRTRLETARKKLFEVREKRIRPRKDDKVLTDWNGLMIAALAEAAEVFGEPKYAEEAIKTAAFVHDTVRTRDGRLLHRFRGGDSGIAAKLDDYAFTIWGLLNLYEATFEIRYLEEAIDLEKASVDLFWDDKAGGFFLTAKDAEKLLARPKEIYDGALPSGNSVQMMNLIRIGRITADPAYESRADQLGRAFAGNVRRSPTGSLYLLSALDFAFGPSFEIVLAGDLDSPGMRSLRDALASVYIPNKVVVLRPANEKAPAISKIATYTKAQRPRGNNATAYVCTNYSCKLPTNDAAVMLRQLHGGS